MSEKIRQSEQQKKIKSIRDWKRRKAERIREGRWTRSERREMRSLFTKSAMQHSSQVKQWQADLLIGRMEWNLLSSQHSNLDDLLDEAVREFFKDKIEPVDEFGVFRSLYEGELSAIYFPGSSFEQRLEDMEREYESEIEELQAQWTKDEDVEDVVEDCDLSEMAHWAFNPLDFESKTAAEKVIYWRRAYDYKKERWIEAMDVNDFSL